jgi:hypothetical protein
MDRAGRAGVSWLLPRQASLLDVRASSSVVLQADAADLYKAALDNGDFGMLRALASLDFGEEDEEQLREDYMMDDVLRIWVQDSLRPRQLQAQLERPESLARVGAASFARNCFGSCADRRVPSLHAKDVDTQLAKWDVLAAEREALVAEREALVAEREALAAEWAATHGIRRGAGGGAGQRRQRRECARASLSCAPCPASRLPWACAAMQCFCVSASFWQLT